MTFEGFSTSGLDFLTELADHDKGWFSENRKTYEREVAQPAKDFVRVSQHEVGFATGINFSSVDSWRERIDDESSGGALVTAFEELGSSRDLAVAGQGLKRVPAPYSADHPRAGLLRHKGFQARRSEPTPAVVH